MKIFITGSTGFIGSRVVARLLAANHELLLLTRNPPQKGSASSSPQRVHYIQGDLSSIEKWKDKVLAFHPEAIFHLAWEDLRNYDPEVNMRNLAQSLNLYSLAIETKCNVLLATGSGLEYGPQPVKKMNENMRVHPQKAYSIAKNVLNEIGTLLARQHGIRFIWLRLFSVYGPQNGPMLMPYVISCIKNNQIPELKNPYGKSDFVYVEDVADAIVTAFNKSPEIGLYNVGTGRLTSVRDIVKRIYHLMGKDAAYKKISWPLKAHIPLSMDYYADISRIKKELSWSPVTNLEEGMKKTVAALTKIR